MSRKLENFLHVLVIVGITLSAIVAANDGQWMGAYWAFFSLLVMGVSELLYARLRCMYDELSEAVDSHIKAMKGIK